MKSVLVIHGPNLNLLGTREPHLYGNETLQDINDDLDRAGREMGIDVDTFQSNHEGDIVEKIHQASGKKYGFIIINPAAFTHTSVAVRDALAGCGVPFVEVHISNIFQGGIQKEIPCFRPRLGYCYRVWILRLQTRSHGSE